MRLFILPFLLLTTLYAKSEEYSLHPKFSYPFSYMGIKILDAKRYTSDGFFSPSVHELSGITWFHNTLYGVDDNGYLYTFSFKLKNKKIQHLQLETKKPLRDKNGKKLHGSWSDAEDLAHDNSSLYISFENQERVMRYSLHAIALKKMKLHKDLRKMKKYKDKNEGLESVAYFPRYGVVTAPESPLKGSSNYHTLYSKDTIWRFKAKGKITSLQKINSRSVLVLLRKYSIIQGRYTALVRVDLQKCNKKRVCRSEVLAKFDSKKGWNIDNFEGVCKLDDTTYLMVSDDNQNPFQKTLFVLFELLD